ncbi:transcription factor Tfb4 [Auriculariales sp. MPI-PUGE-AT-0066]|nr:transcription factor Tfb4 [Auriculariales sp. MPI-PUGE-AT-0066]
MQRSSHLSLILDLSPTQWYLSAQPANENPLSLADFFSAVSAFMNAHVGGSHSNTLTVLGAFPAKSVVLYSSSEPKTARDAATVPDSSFAPFYTINSTVIQRVKDELALLGNPAEEEPTALVSALTRALCYINRIVHPPPPVNPADVPTARILVLSVSPDLSSSYIPLMNSIFSAQKLRAPIDVCRVYGPDAVFLQQAAHLTGGCYLALERRDGLLQNLVMSFLSSPETRNIITVPTQAQIDFRAACFCHKENINIGYVCSVCLSIFCTPVPVCSTCRSKFPIKTFLRLRNMDIGTSTGAAGSATNPVSRAATPTRGSSPAAPPQSLSRQASLARPSLPLPPRPNSGPTLPMNGITLPGMSNGGGYERR